MQKSILRLALFSLVALFSFTACQKENIKEQEAVTQDVEIDESLQLVLDQLGMTYEELINTPLDYEVAEVDESEETISSRGDGGTLTFCCDITGHLFWANGQGPCNYNSSYRFFANSGKTIVVTVVQTQLVGNTINTYNLAAGRFVPTDETCYESSIDVAFEVLDLPGFNSVVSNMWIIDIGTGVCDHHSETAVLACP